MTLKDLLKGLLKLLLMFSCFLIYLFSGSISQFRNSSVHDIELCLLQCNLILFWAPIQLSCWNLTSFNSELSLFIFPKIASKSWGLMYYQNTSGEHLVFESSFCTDIHWNVHHSVSEVNPCKWPLRCHFFLWLLYSFGTMFWSMKITELLLC